MRITFAGCGDAFGSCGRFNTCFHVAAGATHFLIDCGALSMIALKRARTHLNVIETIFVTRFPGDRFSGIDWECQGLRLKPAAARLGYLGRDKAGPPP